MVWSWIIGKRASLGPSGQLDDAMRAMRANSRPCVLLRQGNGKSRIGGKLDDLVASEWPTRNGEPLSFLAQLDLTEVRQADGPDWLPPDGDLLFFYDVEHEPWGFDPADRGGWRVIYRPAGMADAAADATPDLPQGLIFAEKRLSAIASESLPEANSDRLGLGLQGLSDDEWDQLFDVSEDRFEGLPGHQVGGFARPIQGDHMELEAQLASNGIYCGDPSGYEDPRAKELESGAKDWLLLLQLDSDDDVDMMWGDGGRLYFWIREQDARSGDFSNVWMVLQCC